MGRIGDRPDMGFHPVQDGGWRIFVGMGGDQSHAAYHWSTEDIDDGTALAVLEALRDGADWDKFVEALPAGERAPGRFCEEVPQQFREDLLKCLLHQASRPLPKC